jgi:hypothetical protein
MDQIGHLTGIFKQMMTSSRTGKDSVKFVEAFYDKNSDRWNKFTGLNNSKNQEYVFDQESFQWISVRE